MSDKKKSITFYADPDVARWYGELGYGEGTRRINDLIRASFTAQKKTHKEAKQPLQFAFSFNQMQVLLEALNSALSRYDGADEVDPDEEGMDEVFERRDKLQDLISYIRQEL